MRGIVRTFRIEKGYGFIESEDGKNVFVHVKQIELESFPNVGDKVEFELTETEKGYKAYNVKKIEDAQKPI